MNDTVNIVKTGKWTEDEASNAAKRYAELGSTPEAVEAVADELGRSKRSVQGKLTTMGVYVVPEKPKAKKRDEGPTKGEILTEISNLGFDVEGFDPATKTALTRLRDFVASKSSD